ncbi:hypothetical protein DL766_005059 [Monosporascus sp. MC13-8B]|nr:hypothetical protein DL763_008966 [Monosporascus cannonballus]RYP30123.1 hypothetical protein DL766_005059 [Monosporascus sp. MC13-8B]
MAPSKNIAFDVVGTLVSYDHLFEAIESVCGSRLKEVGIQPRLLGCCWLEMAEREYTYLSLSGRYVSFFTTLTGLFYRTLWMAGVTEPRRFVVQEDVDLLVDAFKGLEMRPGAAECIAMLRDAGFTVWGFTAGDLERVGGYFARAGIDMPAENLLSCDSTGKSKPEPECYRPVLEKLSSSGTQPWFAAAHMWDASAARAQGFKAAYTTVFEGEPLHELFGDMDVVADSLPAMANKIIAAEGQK